VARRRRRRAALFLFTALCTLGPSAILRNRALTKADWGSFLIISTVLASMDKVRSKVKSGLFKLKQWKDGLVKHSPAATVDAMPPHQSSNGSSKKRGLLYYIFKNDNAADQVTLIGVLINLVLSAGKFVVGITCHSSALIADAGHSLSDLFSDFVTLYSVQIARLPPDDDHPYGHGKFEAIGSLFLALTLLGTGLSVGAHANKELISIIQLQRSTGGAGAIASKLVHVPTPPALFMAGISIISKEWLFRITRNVGERIKSQVVIANAWHHRSDAYSSVLAMISIGFAMAVPSLVWADAAAGILVAGMISMTGVEILGESIKQLSDSTNEELVQKVEKVLQTSVDDSEDDVTAIHRVRARQVGSSAIVDVQLGTVKGLSGSAVRTVEERMRSKLFRSVPGILDADIRAQPALATADGSPITVPTVNTAGNGATGEVCPLLLSDIESTIPSAGEVEQVVRQQVAFQPDLSLRNVVVNYHQTINVVADVTVRVKSTDRTIAEVKERADQLKALLESAESITTANIFLDMNFDNDDKYDDQKEANGSSDFDQQQANEMGPSLLPQAARVDGTNYTQTDPSLSSLAP